MVLGKLQTPQSSVPLFFLPPILPSLPLFFFGYAIPGWAELCQVLSITEKMGLIPVWIWHLTSFAEDPKFSLRGYQGECLSYCLPLENGITKTTLEQLGGLKI